MISALLLGLLGSLHCFLMCGPLVASLGLRSSGGLLNGALIYQLGRMAIYCLLGSLAGIIGYGFSLVGLHRYIAVALGLQLIGISIKELFYLHGGLNFNPWASFSYALLRWKNKLKIKSSFWWGMVNGLLPCGLVYVALTGALVYDSPYQSMLYMLWFGLGTCPVMVGCFLFPKLKLNQRLAFFPRLFPLSVLVMGLWILTRGLGLGIPYFSPTEQALKITTVDATENCTPINEDRVQKKLP